MSLPVHDWQFWVVSGAAALALLYMIRSAVGLLLPKRRRKRARGRRTTLTVKGRSVS